MVSSYSDEQSIAAWHYISEYELHVLLLLGENELISNGNASVVVVSEVVAADCC